MFTRSESLKDFIRYYPIVSVLLFIQISIFMIGFIPFFPHNWIIENLSGINLSIANGEFWRLLTPIFLHSGIAHLLMNSLTLVIFGPVLEKMIGKVPFLTVYLLAGIIGNIATFFLQPLTYIHVGSSGAIFGLFGFFLSIFTLRKDMLSREHSKMIVTITILGMVMSFIQPNINITAHVFGLMAGYFIGFFIIRKA